jgi:hypothetical protein
MVAKRTSAAALLYEASRYPKIRGALIPEATLVQVTELKLDNRGPVGGVIIWIRARFVDGPLNGEPVELAFISKPKSPSIGVPVVNTNLLKLVREP